MKYILDGAFWMGFRSATKWVAPLYVIFFLVSLVYLDSIWSMSWSVIMMCLSFYGSFMAWGNNEGE